MKAYAHILRNLKSVSAEDLMSVFKNKRAFSYFYTPEPVVVSILLRTVVLHSHPMEPEFSFL